ncbi:MAG: hypothetical protein ACYS26_19440 [Planctomycetota bacterium]
MITTTLLSLGLFAGAETVAPAPIQGTNALAASLSGSLLVQDDEDTSYAAPGFDTSFDYTYVQGGFTFEDLEGFKLEGFYRPEDSRLFYLARLSLGELEGDTDITSLSAGLGYIFPTDNDLDFFVTAEAEWLDIESADELEFRAGGGVRYMADEHIELNGEVHYRSGFEDAELFGLGRGLYHFNETVAAFGEVEVGDDVTWFTLGARLGL